MTRREERRLKEAMMEDGEGVGSTIYNTILYVLIAKIKGYMYRLQMFITLKKQLIIQTYFTKMNIGWVCVIVATLYARQEANRLPVLLRDSLLINQFIINDRLNRFKTILSARP